MLVHAHGFAINRGIADHVHVELDVRVGLPAFSVIGLGGGAARDARERVQAAVLNSGFGFPRKRLTVNLAPAAAGRGAPAFDLALACCVLAVQEEIDASRLARVGLFAELGLGGDLRPCECVAAAAEAAEESRLAGLIVARTDLREARAGRALQVAGLGTLREVAALLSSTPAAGSRAARAPARSAARVIGGRPSSVTGGADVAAAPGATRGRGGVSSGARGADVAAAPGATRGRGGVSSGARGADVAAAPGAMRGRGQPSSAARGAGAPGTIGGHGGPPSGAADPVAIGRRGEPPSSAGGACAASTPDPFGAPRATPRAANNARPP
jgi:magnesium chelatase family protein